MRVAAQVAGIAIERKQTDRALEEYNLSIRLLQQIASAASDARGMDDLIESCLNVICEGLGWLIGHAYALDPEEPDQLISTGVWRLPASDSFKALRTATLNVGCAHGEGIVGRAADLRTPVCIRDVYLDPLFRRRDDGQELHVRGAFAFPILANGELQVVLEFFQVGAGTPPEPVIAILEHVGAQLGRVFERIRSEQALREGAGRFRALYDDNPSMFFTIGEDGTIVSLNRLAAEQLGTSSATIIGTPWVSLHHGDDRAQMLAQLETCRQNPDHVYRWEVRKQRSDGSSLWVRESARLVRDHAEEEWPS